MGLFDTIAEAASAILGGSSSSSSSASGSSSGGSNYGSLVGSLFGSSQITPKKEAKDYDRGIYGYGSSDQYKPTGSTFTAYGTQHESTEKALKHLDNTMCYSGTLICPICGKEKSSPSAYNRCLQEHEQYGYDCKGLYL